MVLVSCAPQDPILAIKLYYTERALRVLRLELDVHGTFGV